MSDTFQFKNFIISQKRCAMKVGTDGVLLGAWAKGGLRILDIGTGTGLIALMMAQRFPEAQVIGVEINDDAASEAVENVMNSPYKTRITVKNIALQDYQPLSRFDAIVTNPPFFANGFSSPGIARRQARQTDCLSYRDIFMFAREWLATDGELSAIIPYELGNSFSEQAYLKGFFLSRWCEVRTVARKQPKRLLVAFSLTRPTTLDKSSLTLVDSGGQKTDEYRSLTSGFYLDS